ncbi:calcineurin B-like protein 5 [Rosa chinensis]|nr:calcineurin B-like protein 5 [Rosa chinensis]
MAMTSSALKEEELKLAVFQNSSKQSLFFDRIFMDAYGKADDRIDEEEWKEYVTQNPSLLENMILPYLMYVLTPKSTF